MRMPTLQEIRPKVLVVGIEALATALLSADVLVGGLFDDLDLTIRDRVAAAGEPPIWADLSKELGEIAISGTLLVIVTAVTMQVLWRWWPALLVAANMMATGVLILGLKWLIGRPGPNGSGPWDGQRGSFPSGHTAVAAVCVGTTVFLVIACLSRGRRLDRARRWGIVGGLAVGLLVGAAVVLDGYHWVSDSLASVVLVAIILEVGFTACMGYVDQPSDVPERV
ncbi:MAG: phosphatase PAP2 family protein [Nocardioidaceae bacterium]